MILTLRQRRFNHYNHLESLYYTEACLATIFVDESQKAKEQLDYLSKDTEAINFFQHLFSVIILHVIIFRKEAGTLIKEKLKRNDKDSVFRVLFNDEDKLRELYNASEDTVYGEDIPIFIETLENGIFVDAVKDQTFRINDEFVVLIEHKRSLRSLLQSRCSFRCPFRLTS